MSMTALQDGINGHAKCILVAQLNTTLLAHCHVNQAYMSTSTSHSAMVTV